MMVQFFICLALWYACKSTPIDRLNIFIIFIKHCISAAITIATWLLIIYLYSKGLDWIFQSTTWSTHYINALPTLLIVGIFLYFLACFVYYILLATEKVQRAEQLALQQQLMATKAELRSLQTIISPHFLFNSLTALSTLTKSNPDRAQEMCLQLAEFLQYCMKYSQTYTATVENELDHIENYLSIEKIRVGERLRVEKKSIPEPSTFPFCLLHSCLWLKTPSNMAFKSA
jgi:sensor histidine kinase YesM